MAFIHYILFLTLSLSISQQTEANDWLVQAECHNAMVPATCMECLKSDDRTGGAANAAGIATIVVGCVNGYADNLIAEMSQSASSKLDKGLAAAFEECCGLLGSAKKELVAAAEKIERHDFDGADHSVYSAFNYGVVCNSKIDEAAATAKVEVSAKIRSVIKVHEELCEAAMRIIERLK